MSSQISANLVPSQNGNLSKENHHLADFNPNFWGEIFLSSPSDMDMDARTSLEYEELKQEARRMLVSNTNDKPTQKLHIIDAVQRLGLAYHFEKEIDDALHIIYHHHHCNHIHDDDDDDDLYTTAVRFCLLREHGFSINCGLLKPTAVPTSALNRILNLTRVIDLLYKDEDAYTNVGVSAKDSIIALLIDPVPI